ncbi:MAG: dihydroorotase [Kiritimatiellae bacterium]|nr:dihydroorotase [Kiritimatiellia bacterium]
MVNLAIRNVRLVDPVSGRDEVTDFVVRDGVIQSPGTDGAGLESRDGEGCVVAPGLWDVHVHFRDPGNPAAETTQTGAVAAAAGGFTHVVTMPNTSPACDNAEQIRAQLDPSLPVRILPSASVTRGRAGGELADLALLSAAGVSSFTDDGNMVVSDELMFRAMTFAQSVGKPVMDHAVVPSIAQGGVIRDCPLARDHGWRIFPPEAEVEAAKRDIRLCEQTGCRTDIQHISCGETVRLIREARARGIPVTGEATPHHLSIAVEDIPDDDAGYKMNPPLGTREDVAVIRQGALDGTLSLFATDHAPHTAESKAAGFASAPFGIIGLETALGVTWRVMVDGMRMSLLDFFNRWVVGPAQLLGVAPMGLNAGRLADFVLIDTQNPWTVDPSRFRSKSRNQPYTGWTLPVRPLLTVCEGRETFRERTGEGR